VIENSRLVRRMAEEERLRREVEIASAVQRRLFPEAPPEIEHLDIAGLCQPAQGVGGDYYDFLPLRDGRLGIAVADVAGKGLSAALLMSIVQASLRSQAGSGDGPLSELVSSMNRLLYRSTERNSFASFFYAQFEEDTRRLTYVNAGHNPPMLFRRGLEGSLVPVAVRARAVVAGALAVQAPDEEANVVLLRSGGLVIGAVATATYEEQSLQLAAGDVLVLYTDGVTESFNAQWQEFGEERLRTAAAASLHLPAAGLASTIMDRVHEWRGDAPQHDDITLVVAKVK
jgi:sigma-B regulation protein RsbU (phosphoserine phosphatase)